MTDVFISYSRKDLAFARLIHKSLQSQGFDTWIDWEQIAIGEKWWQEIKEAIENSNTFIVVISKESIESKVCHDEVEHAIKNNKRIIPIIVDEFKPNEVKSISVDLPEYNWILIQRDRLYKESVESNHELSVDSNDLIASPIYPDFDHAMEKVQQAIKTDYEWVKFHTKLQLRSLEWEKKKDSSRLLRGKELIETERQISEATDHKSPGLTSLQRSFILQSQKNHNRNRTMFMTSMVVIAILMGILGIWGQKNAITAQSNEAIAQEEKVKAEKLAAVNLARYLVSEAQKIFSNDPTLSILLAIESIKQNTPPIPQSEEGLRNLLVDFGSTPIGKGLSIGVQFSNNGEWMLVRTYKGFELFLITTSANGIGFHSVLEEKETGFLILFSQQAQRMVYISQDNTLRYFYKADDLIEPVILLPDAHSLQNMVLDSTGRWLVLNEEGKNTKIIDLNSPSYSFEILNESYLLSNELLFLDSKNALLLRKQGGYAKIHNLNSQNETAIADHEKLGQEIRISENSKWMFSNGYVWNLSAPELSPIFLTDYRSSISKFSNSEKWFFLGNKVWSIINDNFISFSRPEEQCLNNTIELSPDELWLFCSPSEGEYLFFDTGDPLSDAIRLSGNMVFFSQDSQFLALIKNDSTILVFSLADRIEKEVLISGLENGITSIHFYSNNQKLAVLGNNGVLLLLDLDSPMGPQELLQFSLNPIILSTMIPGKEILFTIDSTYKFNIADLSRLTSEPLVFSKLDDSYIYKVSPDGKWMAISDSDQVILKNLDQTYPESLTFAYGSRKKPFIAFSEDGNYLLLVFSDLLRFISIPGTEGKDHEVFFSPHLLSDVRKFNQTSDGRVLVFTHDQSYSLGIKQSNDVAQCFLNLDGSESQVLSPDGNWLYVGNYDATISRVNLNNLQIEQFRSNLGGMSIMSISPDGKWLTSLSDDRRTVSIWDLSQDSNEPAVIWNMPVQIKFLEFSPNNRWLAIGFYENRVFLYDLLDFSISPKDLPISGDFLTSIKFSADSKFLATGSSNGSLQLWESEVPLPQPMTLSNHKQDINDILFSKDGKWIVTQSIDGTIQFWSYPISEVINTACALLSRNMTPEEWNNYFPSEEYRETCP